MSTFSNGSKMRFVELFWTLIIHLSSCSTRSTLMITPPYQVNRCKKPFNHCRITSLSWSSSDQTCRWWFSRGQIHSPIYYVWSSSDQAYYMIPNNQIDADHPSVLPFLVLHCQFCRFWFSSNQFLHNLLKFLTHLRFVREKSYHAFWKSTTLYKNKTK